jgi:hypothetical protein
LSPRAVGAVRPFGVALGARLGVRRCGQQRLERLRDLAVPEDAEDRVPGGRESEQLLAEGAADGVREHLGIDASGGAVLPGVLIGQAE